MGMRAVLGLEGLENCPYRPKSPPGETRARATALGTAHGNIPLPLRFVGMVGLGE